MAEFFKENNAETNKLEEGKILEQQEYHTLVSKSHQIADFRI